jgi:anti-sigma regulatory factor (Ser/Thr protein kinase)
VRSWTFPASTASIAEARNQVADYVGTGSFAALCEDVRLMVSELVTNAIVHASSGCQVTVGWGGEVLRIDVADRSDAPPELQPQTLTEANGRGLFIVQSLATRWGVERTGSGKSVWFELIRQPAASP